MHTEHFSQYELEFEINKSLNFGDEGDIAKVVKKSPGMISQYLNPNDDRESPLFKAAAIFAAWIEVDADGGLEALTTFHCFVRRALNGKETCVKTARRKSHKERTEFHLADAEDAPITDRITELEESLLADNELLDSLRAEAKRETQKALFKGLPVSTETRQAVARAASNRTPAEIGKFARNGK